MKNVIKLICFICFTVLIFFIKKWYLLTGIFLITILEIFLCKIPFRNFTNNFKLFIPVIFITMIINVFLASIYNAILMGVRMIICYNITYIFSSMFSILEIGEMIEKMFWSLKLFSINPNNIGMVVVVTMSTIPVLKNKINMIIMAMKAKGKKFKVRSIANVMKPFFISILIKTNEMEKSLMIKAYDEN